MIIQHAYIEIINSCNLNCRTCYNRSGIPHKKQELSFSDFQSIYRRLIDEFGCKRISLSGGEPTLHSNFDEILDFSLQSPEIETAVVTNGTTAHTALSKKYHEYKNLRLQISLDGSNEAVNAATRGAGNFEKTAAFLKTLTDVPDKILTVKMVVSQNNIADIKSYYDWAVQIGAVPTFDFINSIGNASDDWPALALSAQQKLYILRTVNEKNQQYHLKAVLPYCTHSCPLDLPQTEHSVLIKTDGSMNPCQILYDDAYRLGNILTDTTETIESGLQRIAAIVHARKQIDLGCSRCPTKDFCEKGCMALALMYSGDPLGDDGECTYRKLQLLGFHMTEQGAPV